MVAPVATARQAPVGIRLEDGFSTKITFAADPDVSFWEMTVQPPSIDGGDSIETTTMHNAIWRTFASRKLKTLGETALSAAYDPVMYTQAQALVNVETTVTVTFPDGSTLAFYGYLRTFEVGDHAEGEMPECSITIQPTNVDPATGGEEAPTYVDVPGT